MAQGYGQIAGHAEHHKFKHQHHTAMAKHHHAIAQQHEKAAAHHAKMAGIGQAETSQMDDPDMDEDQDTVQNAHVGGMFGRGPR